MNPRGDAAGREREVRPGAGPGDGTLRPRFFLPSEALDPAALAGDGPSGLELPVLAEDAYHARTVLRARVGEACEVVLEPHGLLAGATFSRVGKVVAVRLGPLVPYPGGTRIHLTLVQALPAARKMDLVMEKGTEVGVDAFVVVPAEGSPPVPAERLRDRLERWRRVAREAARQSRQLAVPTVRAAGNLEQVQALLGGGGRLEDVVGAGQGQAVLEPAAGQGLQSWLEGRRRLLAGLVAAFPDGLPAALHPYLPPEPAQRLVVWVGPEGGWSAGERECFAASGLPLVTLGRRVLRTETAGAVAAAVVRFCLGDW